MPSLPLSTAFTDSAVTEGAFKTAMTNQREYLASLLGTDGLKSTALATLGALFGSLTAKSSNYTVIASDNGKIIQCTNTFTLSLTAAATLGSSFAFVVNNVGVGNITIDPSGAELIDGASTKIIAANTSATVYCDGATFYTLGGGVTSLNGQTGAITNTDYGAIGSYVIAAQNTFGMTERLPNVTVAGSTLIRTTIGSGNYAGINLRSSLDVTSSGYVSLGLSGTWRRLTRSIAGTSTGSGGDLYVRIS